jgi:hypothetical protein
MKNTKLIFLILILTILNGCADVKEGLTGQKRGNSDEFLIKKKNPLILPPDFEKLPIPNSNTKEEDIENLDNNISADIKKLLGELPKKNKGKSIKIKDNELEKKILEKINVQ